MRHIRLYSLIMMLLFLPACQQVDEQQSLALTPAGTPSLELPALSELVGTPAPEIAPLPRLDRQEIVQGRQIYREHCAACHGENLQGEPAWQVQNEDGSFRAPPHNESGHTWHHSDRLLTEIIELGGARLPTNIGGTSPMPAFDKVLTRVEIIAVINFIKSSWPDDVRAIQWEQSARDP